MNKAGFLFLGAVLSITGGAAMMAGCGGDTTTSTSTGSGGGTTGTGGSTGTTTGSAGGGGSSSTTTTTATSSSTGVAPTLDCAAYCGEVTTNCKGADEQYKSMESCLAVCATFPAGTLADTSGNTLGCRLYHGGVAGSSAANATTHCPHAGITGGDKDVTDVMPGTCGEGCDAFCDAAQVICTGANSQYANKDACLTDCKGFKVDAASYSTADIDKDDFGCRAYHLTVAAESAANATAHCGHIIGASPVCTK